MSIQPASDLILDVARAADPTRASAVAQRLNAIAADAPTDMAASDFAQALEQTGSAATPRPALVAARGPDRNPIGANSPDRAKTQFEAMLLTSLIGEMMPKDTPEAFGGGMSGDMWKSMLAEKMADQIAKSGALGLSRRLFANSNSPAASALLHTERSSALDHAGVIAASGNALSLPPTVQAPNGGYLFARGKSA